jgi:hypothetical protein
LIFDIPFLISYLSRYMTLLPGDVISTGTPSGVGLGLKPPRFLKPGDVVELGIEGLGTSRQVARSYGQIGETAGFGPISAASALFFSSDALHRAQKTP